MTLENFGRNVRFDPQHLLVPTDNNAVLVYLEQFRGHRIRAVGRLHSWSAAAVSQGVTMDLRHLDDMALQVRKDGSVHVDVGAGCTVDSVLSFLGSQGYTLPTCSIVGKQTIAGAVATATHGAGRSSLSHYVTAMSVAAYGPDGKPRIYDWEDGGELRAARCGLGCTGIVLSVRMRVEPSYLIEERTQWFDRVDQVVSQAGEYPRQQFYLVPWKWRWYAQLRRPVAPGPGAHAGVAVHLHRALRSVGVDIIMNGAVRLLAGKLRSGEAVKRFYRRAFPLLARSDMHVIDDAGQILMMRHDLYRHVEMELFVPARHLTHAAAFVEWVLRWCGGESAPMPDDLLLDDFGANVPAQIELLKSTYVHDYPITFREVLRDDTLISMTSGDESPAWYAISLITYQRDTAGFLTMAAFTAAAMASAYRARPHWGKICPLDTQTIAALYPALPQFRAHCASVDPEQVFVNDFAHRTLGF
jgi:FAD/FMN-containing dehydrogenase